jgi:hypothetical protein
MEGAIFADSAIAKADLPDSLEILTGKCFAHCHRLRSVTFGPGSTLQSIEGPVFAKSGIHRLILPASLQTLDPLALAGANLYFFAVTPAPTAFFARNFTIRDSSGRTVIRSMTAEATVWIDAPVEVIGPSAFRDTEGLESLVFVSANVARIEESAFSGSTLRDLVVPSSVDVVMKENPFSLEDISGSWSRSTLRANMTQIEGYDSHVKFDSRDSNNGCFAEFRDFEPQRE